MSFFKKILIIISSLILLIMLVSVVFKPVLSNFVVMAAKKSARGQYVCSLNAEGRHVGRLYKFHKGKKELLKTFESNSCIFSRPKINAGFFVLAIGGGGGATPYESGKNAQIISKHKKISKPVIVIKIGTGGNGTYFDRSKLIDAKDGAKTEIKDLKLAAFGGSRSTRMTPLGASQQKSKEYEIPEKYRYLYDLPKSSKYGAGGIADKKSKTVKAQNGQDGVVVIQW